MLLLLHGNFESIKALITKGDHHEAITQLESLKEQQDLEPEKKLLLKLLHVQLLLSIGENEKGLEYIEEADKFSQSQRTDFYRLETLLLKAELIRNQGKNAGSEVIRHPSKYSEILPENLQEYARIITQSEQEFNKIPVSDSNEYLIRKAWFYRCKAILLRTKGKFEDSLEHLTTSAELFEPLAYVEELGGTYSSIALAHGIMGDIKQEVKFLKKSLECYNKLKLKREAAIILLRLGVLIFHYQSENVSGFDYVTQSYKILQEIEDENGVAVALGLIGNFYTWLGELDRGLSFLQRSLLLSERFGNTENIAFTLNNIGWNYHNRGELKLALESLNRSLSISREKQYPWILIWVLANIGYVNQAQGNFEDACGFFTHSMNISKEIDDFLALSWGLYQVIKLNLETDSSTPQTLDQIRRLNDLATHYDIRLMKQMYRVAHGILLKKSPRLKNKAQAQEYFEQVAREKIEALEITADAMINQCELLLFEYKNSGDREVFNEIQNLTNRLLDISEKQNSHWLLSETYMLKAELALLQDNTPLTREYITKAQSIAEEKGLHKLALAISREHDKLLDQIGLIEGFSETDLEEKSLIEVDEVEDLLGRMTTRNLAAVTEATPEEPVMLLIIGEGGMSLYNRTFTSNEYVKGPLVGSFLSAIESFSKEVFSSPIERVTLGNYRLILQTHNLLTFSYVYKGESYSAIKRLTKFIQQLEINKEFWSGLINKTDTGLTLNDEEEIILNNIVNNIFG